MEVVASMQYASSTDRDCSLVVYNWSKWSLRSDWAWLKWPSYKSLQTWREISIDITGHFWRLLTHLTDSHRSLKLSCLNETCSNQRSCVDRRLLVVLEHRCVSRAQHIKVKFGVKSQFGWRDETWLSDNFSSLNMCKCWRALLTKSIKIER